MKGVGGEKGRRDWMHFAIFHPFLSRCYLCDFLFTLLHTKPLLKRGLLLKGLILGMVAQHYHKLV